MKEIHDNHCLRQNRIQPRTEDEQTHPPGPSMSFRSVKDLCDVNGCHVASLRMRVVWMELWADRADGQATGKPMRYPMARSEKSVEGNLQCGGWMISHLQKWHSGKPSAKPYSGKIPVCTGHFTTSLLSANVIICVTPSHSR